MGNISLKHQKDSSSKQNKKTNSKKIELGKRFVLSDISKEELEKRRIPIYSYLM